MLRLTTLSFLSLVLLIGCVGPRPEIHWPPKDGEYELVIVGPFYEAQKEKEFENYIILEQVIQDFVKTPRNFIGEKSNIKSIINERFIWESQRQQGEWGALKEMARESTVDPVRVSSVLDAGLHRKKHKRMEVGLRIKDKAEQGYQILEGYLYVARRNIPLSKARWFEWLLVGDEPLKQRVESAIKTLVNKTQSMNTKEKWTIDEIIDYRCFVDYRRLISSNNGICAKKLVSNELIKKYPNSEPSIFMKIKILKNKIEMLPPYGSLDLLLRIKIIESEIIRLRISYPKNKMLETLTQKLNIILNKYNFNIEKSRGDS